LTGTGIKGEVSAPVNEDDGDCSPKARRARNSHDRRRQGNPAAPL